MIPPTKYATIIADPAWKYRNFTDTVHGAAISHYETWNVHDMATWPIGEFAAEDATLALWGTWPKLDDAVLLMSMWGFQHVTGFPWVKVVPSSGEIRTGIGFIKQSVSELVLIGRKGKGAARKPDAKEPGLGLLVGEDKVFYDKIGKHSKKPEKIQDWLEREFVGPYAEFFATRERPGWDCYGYDTGWSIGRDGVTKLEAKAAA